MHPVRSVARALHIAPDRPAQVTSPPPAKPEETSATASDAVPSQTKSEGKVRVRLMGGEKRVLLQATAPIRLKDAKGARALTPGTWRATVSGVTPARQRFHVFPKTFKPGEENDAQTYERAWADKGYHTERIVFGKAMRTADGGSLDNRVYWESLARFSTEQEAAALKERLEKEGVWAWIRPETIAPGKGTFSLSGGSEGQVETCVAPLELGSTAPLGVSNVDSGFWEERRGNRSYAGTLELGVGPDGLLEVYETVSLDDYLRGVLPAEMPASWPAEALKAQAVTARSGVIADLAGKHHLEGFDFCGTEHCRAYEGRGAWHEATDRAIAATANAVLAAGGRVVTGVFSSNCGGWTENNDTVWAAPPDPVLRGVPDRDPNAKGGVDRLDESRIEAWVRSRPQAYCNGGDSFRWTRRFTSAELTAVLNKRHAVGTVTAIEPGPRGASGRLKSVRIVGSKSTLTVQKDLPIRLAFDGLPSALFIVATEKAANKGKAFIFLGGGRGHGVGLCQYGARGMAAAGASWEAIVRHYFVGVRIETMGTW